ncbi:glycosyltransferase family 2 protein [Histidinibacterium aquaticum]|uniref:Glycosyltransferase n=1 Tax=Histidinibacterium aquaticum TaxID=2613962 RepID=A0A5J5GAS7_9RHOB|nr:glycosyltransferase [Histidinibacterium aquaticum]KAA9005091.1 glycosyltransferase [Histidinibacterium aquaticum]
MTESLALVVPTRNDHADLPRLLREAAGTKAVSEIVVVDDGSDPPLKERALRRAARGLPVTLLREEVSRGAGGARNRGLEAVSASHLLYFDGDDRLSPEIGPLWADLAGRDYDFCIFRHADSRMLWRGWAQPHADEALWAASGLSATALSGPVSEAVSARLAQAANYPWNKIYRTAFLRENGIRCSEIPVHNDIALHWESFDAARTVLASGRIGALHIVRPGGGRLTNQTGEARLAVFESLDVLARRLLPDRPLALPFLRFVGYLLGWLRENIVPELHPRLEALSARFFARHVGPDFYARIAMEDPVLARDILIHLAMGDAA